MLKKVVCLSVDTFNEWKALLEECNLFYKVENQSDYTGFQALISWTE